MSNSRRRPRLRPAAVLLMPLAAVALAGCSLLGVGGGSSSAAPTPTPSATAADAVHFSARPAGVGSIACSDLLPAGLTAPLVPAIADDDPVAEQRHVDPSQMAPVASGGLVCTSDNGVAAMDSVYPGSAGDPVRNGITATVLPDAGTSLDAFLASGSHTGEDVSCTATDAARLLCTADVHAGSAWLSIALERVQDGTDVTPEGMQDRFRALVAHATTVVAASALGTATVSVTLEHPGPSICVATRVDAVTTGPLTASGPATDATADITLLALDRTGSESCDFRAAPEQGYAAVGARYGTLPGGSWVVRARIAAGLVDPDDRIPLDGLGTHDAAYRTCDDSLCTIDVVRDGDWTRYLLRHAVAPDTSAAIARWATASFGA